jgi:hypothetical protein
MINIVRECKVTYAYPNLACLIQRLCVCLQTMWKKISHRKPESTVFSQLEPFSFERWSLEEKLQKSVNSISKIKLSLLLIMPFVIIMYKGIETYY